MSTHIWTRDSVWRISYLLANGRKDEPVKETVGKQGSSCQGDSGETSG